MFCHAGTATEVQKNTLVVLGVALQVHHSFYHCSKYFSSVVLFFLLIWSCSCHTFIVIYCGSWLSATSELVNQISASRCSSNLDSKLEFHIQVPTLSGKQVCAPPSHTAKHPKLFSKHLNGLVDNPCKNTSYPSFCSRAAAKKGSSPKKILLNVFFHIVSRIVNVVALRFFVLALAWRHVAG